VVPRVEAGNRAQAPRWMGNLVEIDQPLVDAVTELVLDRTVSAVGDDTMDDRRQNGEVVGRCHHVTPRALAASTPERQPSSWNPQPW
jgi:hypothetical protein